MLCRCLHIRYGLVSWLVGCCKTIVIYGKGCTSGVTHPIWAGFVVGGSAESLSGSWSALVVVAVFPERPAAEGSRLAHSGVWG